MSKRRIAVARLAGFCVLAGLSSHHWFALVADTDPWRWAVVLGASVLAGAALTFGVARIAARPRRVAAAMVILGAALTTGLVAIGIPARLVLPGGWAELSGELDAGLAGVSQVGLPYEGADVWTALGILAAAPLALTLACAVTFWPSRGHVTQRAGGLVVLVALYGSAVTWEAPSAELGRGLLLFVAIAAFVWLPVVHASRAFAAAIAIALAGLAALPLATRVEASDPVIAYTSWKLFGDEPVATFNWDHSYGPLDWPQEGTELFEVRSDAPLYWKTTVLDEFDGAAWGRADTDYADSGTDYELAGASAELISENPRWIREFEVTVGPLESDLAVVAGSAPGVNGLDLESASGDGTTLLAAALAEGSTYGVRAYAPNPTARKLRRGPQSYPPGLERYTTLLLSSTIAGPTVPVAPLAYVTVPPSGAKETPAERSRGLLLSPIDGAVEGSSYERVLRLARRVTRGAETDHEAVARIERYLLDNYEYEQEVPDRREPLPDFLFRDRIGYCQQFSGSMVLMLRMLGIPSRVAAGFAPGQADAEQGTYVVRDTDAHSWVEVFFPEVGWVTVDPTPSAAPARTGTTGSADGAASTSVSGLGRAFSLEESADPGGSADPRSSRPARAEESPGSPVPFLVFAGAFLAFGGVRYRRRRRLLSPAGAALQVRELEDALHTAGQAPSSGTTLLQIERILGDIAGPRAARYAASLRENRYSADRPRRPGPDARRELRSALARGRGPVGWLRALRAIPPGGPRA